MLPVLSSDARLHRRSLTHTRRVPVGELERVRDAYLDRVPRGPDADEDVRALVTFIVVVRRLGVNLEAGLPEFIHDCTFNEVVTLPPGVTLRVGAAHRVVPCLDAFCALTVATATSCCRCRCAS